MWLILNKIFVAYAREYVAYRALGKSASLTSFLFMQLCD